MKEGMAKTSSPYHNFDWEAYNYRPRYPESLTRLILEYHDAHSQSRRLAHDIGSGNGVYAEVMAPHFKNLHASDPGRDNVSRIRKRFEGRDMFTGLSYSQGGAEDAESAIPEDIRGPGPDLITCMEAIHWPIDIDKAIAAISRSLAPNGTLALVIYGIQAHVVGNDEANRLLSDIFVRFAQQAVKTMDHDMSRGISAAATGTAFVPISREVFDETKTRRIWINTQGDRPFWSTADVLTLAPSRSTKGEINETYSKGHPAADGWAQYVDRDWWKGLFESLAGQERSDWEADVERLKVLLGDQETLIEWPVSILLATKKISTDNVPAA